MHATLSKSSATIPTTRYQVEKNKLKTVIIQAICYRSLGWAAIPKDYLTSFGSAKWMPILPRYRIRDYWTEKKLCDKPRGERLHTQRDRALLSPPLFEIL